VIYDGKNRMWKPTRRFAFNQMQKLKMIWDWYCRIALCAYRVWAGVIARR
jgi:hypothetical protein